MNIAEILKIVPKGTKLYSPIFGEVTLMSVNSDFIDIIDSDKIIRTFYSNGTFYKDGECMLFPSRENRDWNNMCLFKNGDILISSSGNPFIFKEVKGEACSIHCGLDTGGRFWKCSNNWTLIRKVRKATEKEIDLFFERLRKEGFKWNSNTLTLEKLEDKFDITTLKPFDKVLIRDSEVHRWRCNFYSYYRTNENRFKYACISDSYNQCIPYNDETKHLIGTTDDCPEYYKTW